MLRPDESIFVMAEQGADRRVVPIEAVFNRGEESLGRRFGERPEVGRERPPAPRVGVAQQTRDDRVRAPRRVFRGCADLVTPERQQD